MQVLWFLETFGTEMKSVQSHATSIKLFFPIYVAGIPTPNVEHSYNILDQIFVQVSIFACNCNGQVKGGRDHFFCVCGFGS